MTSADIFRIMPILKILLICSCLVSCQKFFWETKPAVDSDGNTIEITAMYTNGISEELRVVFIQANSELKETSVIKTGSKFSDFEINQFDTESCNIFLFDKNENKIDSVLWKRKERWNKKSAH